jgi:hypothetical protein
MERAVTELSKSFVSVVERQNSPIEMQAHPATHASEPKVRLLFLRHGTSLKGK